MDHAARVYDSVLDMLPCEENPSPMVRLQRLCPVADYALYAKLEWLNPFGSVKDRAAWEMIRDLEQRGELDRDRPQRGMVEPTSGNTGISLAALAGVRGYRLRAVVPARVPAEKRVFLRLAGADVEVTHDALCPLPGDEGGTIGLARSYARGSPQRYVMPNQYENQANVQAHLRTTGPEIWRQTRGRVTHVFVSLGTCGTATGLGRFLKSRNPAVRIIAVQPSPGHDVPGLRNLSELEVSRLFDPTLLDEIIEVDYELAYRRAADLFRLEGLRAGPSSGLIFEGACGVLSREASRAAGGVGVMIFPDDAFKYAGAFARHMPELADPDALLPTLPPPL